MHITIILASIATKIIYLPSMFNWHPSYVITDHVMRHHATNEYTDDKQEWVAATILRRFDIERGQNND